MASHPFLLEVGPMFLGAIFSWGLFGVFLVQIYIYTVWYHHMDRKVIRYMVYSLLLLEFIQTGFVTHTGWEILAYRWGDPTVLLNVPWSAAAIAINCGVVAMIIELYFCWRIWLLGSGRPTARGISILCALLAILQCVAAITFSAEFFARDMNVAFLVSTQSKVMIVVGAGRTTQIIEIYRCPFILLRFGWFRP